MSNKLDWVVEDGKIVHLTVNGKKRATRDLVKAQNASYWKLFPDKEGVRFTNPFTGVQVDLFGFEASICNFVLRWYKAFEKGGVEFAQCPIQVYETMKYLLLDLNTEAYYDLID